MKKLILTIFLFTASISAQTTEEALAKALNKSLNEVEASRVAITAQNAVIEAQKAQMAAMAREAEAKDMLIKLQNAELDRMRAVKCSTTSFLFGLIKNKRCF